MVSEVAIGGIVAGGVTALNLAYNLLMARKAAGDRRAERAEDHREWYRRTLFEKRLSAVQEAGDWLAKLDHGISLIYNAEANLVDSREIVPAREDLATLAKDARAWYDSKAVFLHDDLPGEFPFMELTMASDRYAQGKRFGEKTIWIFLAEAQETTRERLEELIGLEQPS